MMKLFASILFLTSFLIIQPAAYAAKQITISWDDLVPEKGKGVALSLSKSAKIIGMPELSAFEGNKEEQQLYIQYLDEMKSTQPEGSDINIDLHGRKVKLAGYVTPVGFEEENITEFLFVPYLGACIHVPPPPANQIVYVSNANGLKPDQLWEPIWITGIIQAKAVSTVLADVGYSIVGAKVEPYEE